MGRLRVISVEGLIGFKFQGYVNDATRTRDLEETRVLMKTHRASLDAMSNSAFVTDAEVVLVREAGVSYQPQMTDSDPIAEWISLMEVVQMLCPVWPVRDKPMLGQHWRL